MILDKTTSALTYNTYELKGGLRVTNHEPIDDRILWDSIEDVAFIPDGDKPIYYEGLMASTKQGKAYIFTGGDPSVVSNWKDITADVVFPDAKDIELGKDVSYSGETIAPADSSITDAFDAVVEKMVENELTTAAALNDLNGDVQNLSSSTIYIEENYAKKSDISLVYKIVSARVIDISNSGYTDDSTTTYTDVAVGNVVNTVSSVTYEDKTYPVGTNFVCVKSGDTAGKWDALAGVTEIEKVNSASTADVANTLKDFTISGSVNAFTITNKDNVWGINPSDKLVYGVTTTGTGVNVDANIDGNELQLNVAVGIDSTITGLTSGKVLNGIHLTETPTAITASVTDYINSAETSNVAISYPVDSSTTKTFADTFAMLDTYPTAPTKPVVTFTPSLSGLSTLYEVGTNIGNISNSGFVFKLKETTKGKFNSSYEGESSPVYSYIIDTDNPRVVLNGLGFSNETITVSSSSLPNESTAKQETVTYSILLGDNVLTAECHYGFTAPSNAPHTKLGYETTKTGRTAADGTATWTRCPNTAITKTLKIRGAYAMFTNIPQTASTSEDDISYVNVALDPQPNTKSLIDKTEIKIKYPATSTINMKNYQFALAPNYDNKFVIKKYNDLRGDYNGDVTYKKIGSLGKEGYTTWNVYSIDATTETSECRFKITLTN